MSKDNLTFKSRINYAKDNVDLISHLKYDSNTFKKCFYILTYNNNFTNYEKRKHLNKNLFTGNSNTVSLKVLNRPGVYNNPNQNQCKRLMNIVKLKGRTGNQMFELASLFGIAFTYDFLPVISSRTILRKYFDLPKLFLYKSTTLHNSLIYECRTWAKVCNFSSITNIEKGNVTLKGYFQSWKYFNNISDLIKILFKFKSTHIENAKRYLSSISIQNFHRVCMHIRTGDITSEKSISKGFVIPNFTFLEKAKQFYLKRFQRVQFIFVCNDKEWCKQHLHNVIISNFTNPGDDLALLSICDHVVVTLGTFGWWGAWLSGGTTVYFDRYPREGSRLESNMKKEDYYPENWIGIS